MPNIWIYIIHANFLINKCQKQDFNNCTINKWKYQRIKFSLYKGKNIVSTYRHTITRK